MAESRETSRQPRAEVLSFVPDELENQYELFNDYEELFKPQADKTNKEVIFERQYSSPLYVHTLNRALAYSGSEGLRRDDIIRWRIGDQTLGTQAGKPVYGARLQLLGEPGNPMPNKFMEKRFWDDKMYLFPVPQGAIDNNVNLTQNPGW